MCSPSSCGAVQLREQRCPPEPPGLGTQLLGEGIEGELARRASWPTELELRAALAEVTAERDMLRTMLVMCNRWWSVAGTMMTIVGCVIILIVALIALGVLPRP